MAFKFTIITLFFILVFSMLRGQAQPVANFKADVTSGCSPIIVNFKDLSTGDSIYAWSWDFGNGSTSTLQNPTTTYFDPGPKTVKLVVSGKGGRTDSVVKKKFITVIEQPNVDFSFGKNYSCAPYKVQFKDLSTSGAGTKNVSWLWDLGNGTQSTEQNPEFTYTNPDIYTVALTVTNDKGCSKLVTKPNAITVASGVIANFNNSNPSVCQAPATVNFTNASEGPGNISYSWNFGDGSTSNIANPSHQFSTNGKYTVTLVSTSDVGCADTLQKDAVVQIGGMTTDFTAPSQICEKIPAQFLNNSSPTPVSSLWQFSDGTKDTAINPVKKFRAPGTYTVKLTNTYNTCSDVITKNVVVTPRVTVNFTTADTVSCKPFTVNFKNLSTNGATYQWDFGDSTTSASTNPSHTYSDYGTYAVTLVAVNSAGCGDTLRKNHFIKIKKPTISFDDFPKGGCIPYKVSPVATITTLDKVTSYQWDFGDGTQATGETPTHTYTKQGTYALTLTITTSGGCTETYTLKKAVKTGTKPTVDFTSDLNDVCANQAIQFTSHSPDSTDEWKWTFEDGGKEIGKKPSHIFSDTGSLFVQLVAYNNGCASDSVRKYNFVHIKPPIALFDFKPNCDNKFQYTFTDKSLGPKTWHWNFGDGDTSNLKSPPPHTYKALGTYNVTIDVTNGECTNTISKTVQIVQRNLDFTAAAVTGCKPFDAVFTPTAADLPSISTYSWNFGNDSTSSANNQTTYNKPGTYDVSLTTTDVFGCKDSVSKPKYIRVNGPTAAFGSKNNIGCTGLNTTFIDSSATDGVNRIVSWNWDFGDNKTQTFNQAPFQHTYDSTGTFTVKLTVNDASGCSDFAIDSNLVKVSSLKAVWNSDSLTCPGSPVNFKNQSFGSMRFNTLWNFGDQQTSDSFSIRHAYKDSGIYTVKLKVWNEAGCVDSLIKDKYIQVGKPEASFTANNFSTYCTPFRALFTNTSSFYNSVFWDLGVATSRQENPVNFYIATGTYDIKLFITSPGGCRDSVIKQLHVYNPNEATIKYSPLKGCTPVSVDMNAFTNMKARFIWDFGDGNVIDTNTNKINHVYQDFGQFVPKIILQDTSGKCVVPLSGSDVIQVFGAKASFNVDKNFFCDSGSIKISDSVVANSPITKYIWNFGDHTTSGVHNPVHYYANPGLYNVSLTINTQAGCNDTLRYGPIKIVQSPLIHIRGDSVICVNDRAQQLGITDRQDTSQLNWAWNFPNGNTAHVQYPANQQYTTAGNFVINAIATNSSGCTDTASKNILVRPLPFITVPATLSKQAGESVTIPAIYSSNVISYSWSPDSSLSCANCPRPTANPKFGTKYTVAVVDSNGCRNTANVLVVILCKNANVFVPNTFSPNGDGSNDVFYVRGRGLERIKTLRIFNRWGEVVFERRDFAVNDISTGWDGRYKGNHPQPDVYIYQLEAYCEGGEVLRFEGNVALIQ